MMLLALLAATTSMRFQLAKEGDLLAWLVAGPFPNEGALQLKGTGFKTDYLGGEAVADPSEGDAAGTHDWRLASGSVNRGIDLKGLLRWNDPGIAYCFANIESPQDQDAKLLFGSDDGAKVYLNGERLFSKQIARVVKRDEESVALHLKKGKNRLLFKIEQGDGNWGLMARVVGARGLVETLPVSPTKDDAWSVARRLSGAEGALDLDAWERYELNTVTASRFLVHLRDRASHPEKLDAALAAGALATHEASNLDGLSEALRTYADDVDAAYRSARAPLLKWAQNPGALKSDDPNQEDWLRVMPGGHYFVHQNGKPFIPIGANHNPDWPELEQSNPLARDYDPARTDRWFAHMAANGVNVIRLMVETPPSGNLEEPVGLFRPEHVIWLDHVFAAARKHGVRLWVTPYDTFWMSLRKETCPYWAENGGPIVKPIDFLTSPKIMDLQKKRMRFLIDRYGNSGTIFAWEIMNEIDLWWNAKPEQIKSWVDQMAAEVRSYEKRKWGRNHLVTLSFAKPEPEGLNAETAFRRSDLDFATMHLYLGASKGPKPDEAEKAGADYAAGVVYAWEHAKDDRPVLDGESGPIDHWIKDPALDDQVFFEMSWSHLMSGGAGSGTRWPYRQPHHISEGMIKVLRSMSEFCADVPWTAFKGAASISPDRRFGTYWTTAGGGIMWVRAKYGTEFKIRTPEGARHWRMYDILNSRWLGQAQELGHPFQTFTLPEGVKEAAIWMGP
jgi:mannan endo-1,4-beta-mannosidase